MIGRSQSTRSRSTMQSGLVVSMSIFASPEWKGPPMTVSRRCGKTPSTWNSLGNGLGSLRRLLASCFWRCTPSGRATWRPAGRSLSPWPCSRGGNHWRRRSWSSLQQRVPWPPSGLSSRAFCPKPLPRYGPSPRGSGTTVLPRRRLGAPGSLPSRRHPGGTNPVCFGPRSFHRRQCYSAEISTPTCLFRDDSSNIAPGGRAFYVEFRDSCGAFVASDDFASNCRLAQQIC
ncbi:hypothetical protein ARTHRO8AJ_90012 [Arthrobacter sp. 8AJ]|nr:hypothetical protein ARTHRO8AJ_90012 [Arthrobacter sp. 8AJ]